jgi:hypothetical protein
MRSQIFFSMLVVVMTLCVAPSVAAPAPREMLSKRTTPTTMCGVPIRDKAVCKDSSGNWKKDPVNNEVPSTVVDDPNARRALVARGKKEGSDDGSYSPSSSSHASTLDSDDGDVHQCDHAVELQLLGAYGDKSGFCKALDDILKLIHPTVTTAETAPYINKLKPLINTGINFYPIYSKWNAKKKDLTMDYKKGNPAPHATDADVLRLYNRVKAYVKATHPYTVETNMGSVASKLDTEMGEIIKQAKEEADKKTKGSANHITWAPGAETMKKYVEEYITYIGVAASNPMKP